MEQHNYQKCNEIGTNTESDVLQEVTTKNNTKNYITPRILHTSVKAINTPNINQFPQCIPNTTDSNVREGSNTIHTNRGKESIAHNEEITNKDILNTKSSCNKTLDDDNLNKINPFSTRTREPLYNPPKGNKLTKKSTNHCRIIYQNINSLRPGNFDKWKSSLERTTFLEADIIGLCETCVNWNCNTTKKQYKNLL
jgi:hypothetical protein